jgi:hypothetical protein
MSWLAGVVKALLEAILGFASQRLDRRTADETLRETGARQAEAREHDRFAQQAREAAALRNAAAGSDAELDDGLRPPSDRTARRAD